VSRKKEGRKREWSQKLRLTKAEKDHKLTRFLNRKVNTVKKRKNAPCSIAQETEHGRGEIKDNALKAIVTSQLFRTRIVKAKKGKGSYSRKGRGGKEPYSKAA